VNDMGHADAPESVWDTTGCQRYGRLEFFGIKPFATEYSYLHNNIDPVCC